MRQRSRRAFGDCLMVRLQQAAAGAVLAVGMLAMVNCVLTNCDLCSGGAWCHCGITACHYEWAAQLGTVYHCRVGSRVV
jgi:hypothetical protein